MKLIELAKLYEGKIITNDFNLNKVAQLQGVAVLNINELANSLKPIVLPGEVMRVFILKEGKEYNQGVAYLDDGTMVVVDNARKMIGKTIDISVTSVLQTTAGKMIFGKWDERAHGPPRLQGQFRLPPPVAVPPAAGPADRPQTRLRSPIVGDRPRSRLVWAPVPIEPGVAPSQSLRMTRQARVCAKKPDACTILIAPMKVFVIVPAAGLGTRMAPPSAAKSKRNALSKQFKELGGVPILVHTLRKFAAAPAVYEIIVALRKDEIAGFRTQVEKQYPEILKQAPADCRRRRASPGFGGERAEPVCRRSRRHRSGARCGASVRYARNHRQRDSRPRKNMEPPSPAGPRSTRSNKSNEPPMARSSKPPSRAPASSWRKPRRDFATTS